MKRKTEYDATKLTQVATKKSVMTVYVDAFKIEQVKIKFAEFEDAKNTIDIYLSFEDTLRIVQDIKSGKLFRDMQNSQYPIQIAYGGSLKDGKLESRSLSFGMQNDKIYANAQKGPGKATSTGAIILDGQPTKKVSVGMTIDAFKGLFLYTEAGIHAYLPTFVGNLVDIANENRKNINN